MGSRILTSLLAVLFAVSSHATESPQLKKTKYNIIIVSICSLRSDRLPFYGYKRDTAPNLSLFAEQGFIFDNAFTDMSWSNISGFLSSKVSSKFVKDNGYVAIGNTWTKDETTRQFLDLKDPPAEYYQRVPEEHLRKVESQKGILTKEIKKIENKILSDHGGKHFLLETHFKFIHAPYIPRDEVASEAASYQYYLSRIQKDKVFKIRDETESFPDKFAFFSVLFHLIRMTRADNFILQRRGLETLDKGRKDTYERYFGLINNPEVIEKWKKSKGFEDDKVILSDIYDAKIRSFDAVIKDLLQIISSKSLRDNTVVIVTGDHGEALMEHDTLMHATQNYDELIHFPLVIRFPGQKSVTRIPQQFFQGTLGKFVEDLIKGNVDETNFASYLEGQKKADEMIYSRNCNNTIRSVRFKNKWKFIIDFTTDVRELYDLEKDTHEKKNVFADQPDLSAQLEESLMSNLNLKGNNMLHACTQNNSYE